MDENALTNTVLHPRQDSNMHADMYGASGADVASDKARDSDELREHLHRRIRRNCQMYGRQATLLYLARLTGVPIGVDEPSFLAEAEAVLGFEADALSNALEAAGPS